MVKPNSYHELKVGTTAHCYPIYIGFGGIADGSLFNKHIPSQKVLVVSNPSIAGHYLKALNSALRPRKIDIVLLQEGETFKNQSSLDKIYQALIEGKHDRQTTIVALGGGVVGDMAGFAAATYLRGVAYVQVPTTLLAQVDSSVGGKTAINHALGKNLIGAFYQPAAVICDLKTLQTLPQRELKGGLAEVIKYGLLQGDAFLSQIESISSNPIHFEEGDKWIQLIARCCEIKAKIVAQDEKEQGQRALLNLGHTFAHALETHTQYQRFIHGEAVAIGLYCAALLSYKLGYCSKELVVRVDNILQRFQLPNRIPADINPNHLLELMQHDKKVRNDQLRFIIIKQPGSCELIDRVEKQMVQEVLNESY